MLRETRSFSTSLVMLLALVMFACPVFGQDTVADPAAPATTVAGATETTAEEEAAYQARRVQWRDMLHYIQLARADLAESFAEAVLEGAKPEELYRHSIEETGSQVILTRALGNKKLKPIVLKIRAQIDKGYMIFRSDEKEIQRMIVKLGSTNLRMRMRAAKRLAASGE